MAKTFSYRRLEVVSGSPAAEDFKERWPALFCEAEVCKCIPFIKPSCLARNNLKVLFKYRSLVISDTRRILETNYNFLGTELHEQAWRLHAKNDYPNEAQGRCCGHQAEAVHGHTESGVFVKNCACSLFWGMWSVSHTLHTHTVSVLTQ